MKLKTRLTIAFITLILLPLFMSTVVVYIFSQRVMVDIKEKYGIEEVNYDNMANSIHVLNQSTSRVYGQLLVAADESPEKFKDEEYLNETNEILIKKNSFLVVEREDENVYVGTDIDNIKEILENLPKAYVPTEDRSIYMGGELQVLIKRVDFETSEGEHGKVFIVTDVRKMIPEFEDFFEGVLAAIVIILVITASGFIFWIYQSIIIPLNSMKIATQNIKNGNLDFELEVNVQDEIGQLCRDFEEMRMRLKLNAEEKVKYDTEEKELISNISHDLKTPITAIKGYVEGIMDGVADTPEKIDKYIRTIYNKTNEMDRLINELTFYSRIDTNRIPYNFKTIPAIQYFDDCAEEVGLDLEAEGIEFGYFNYLDKDVKLIADAEQLRRVINNIISNSVKYRDKDETVINLRVKDVGDFVQVEIEDNGRGIGAKELPNVFERFYRTDASRNSLKGGSGIGLSIVKKIIEEHGGKIWATSKENVGTVMCFVIRKYEEVQINE